MAALGLGLFQGSQRLGKPGLKVVAKPLHTKEGKLASTNSVELPVSVPGYESREMAITQLEIDWLPKDTTYGRRVYKATNGFEAMVSVVLMGADRTSIHKPEYCLPSQGWVIEKTELASVPISGASAYELPVKKITAWAKLKNPQDPDGPPVHLKGLYVYWFVADNELTAQHSQRMWWITRDLLTMNVLQRWAYVSYFATCHPGQEELLFQQMKNLIALSVPQFQLAVGPGGSALSSASDSFKKASF